MTNLDFKSIEKGMRLRTNKKLGKLIETKNGDAVGMVDSMGEINDGTRDSEIAARLVACWNFCEGISTKGLLNPKLLQTIKRSMDVTQDLQRKMREGRRLDVKKDFSLMVADAQATKVVYELSSVLGLIDQKADDQKASGNLCTACGTEAESIIGCPSGAEVCSACFEGGAT